MIPAFPELKLPPEGTFIPTCVLGTGAGFWLQWFSLARNSQKRFKKRGTCEEKNSVMHPEKLMLDELSSQIDHNRIIF